MRRFRRDLIGHFIRREQRTQQPCTHACCRGYHVHPANMPVILPRRVLRRASDKDLAAHYERVSAQDNAKARRAEAQILYEMERRDAAEQAQRERAAARAAAAEAGRRERTAARAAAAMEREAETERIYQAADAYTRGNWVNPRGRARGIHEREILTGREAVFQRYASDEAREFFRATPRPTTAYFRGRDTRVEYSDPGTRRRRRRGVRAA